MGKTLLTMILGVCLMASSAFAQSYQVQRRDMKLATQQLLEKDTILNAEVSDDDQVKTSFDGPSSAAVLTLTSFTAQPDVPRNIIITPGTTTTDIETCVIVVTGTDIHNGAVTENISFAANATDPVAGLKAFKTVSSVVWPANCESGGFAATWKVGTGDVLGLNHCMDVVGHLAWATFDGAYEATRPTCVADADEVEKNTCDINGTLNGAKDVELFYVQNFLCKP